MLASSTADLRIAGPFIALASVLAGSLGVPVSTFAALVFVGSLLAQGHGGVELGGMVFLAAMAGAVVGDVTWFFAGRRYGTSVLRLICRLSLSRDSCVRRTADTFARHGVKVLLLARFVPGLSVLSAPLAGASGVALPKFISYAETGAAIWIGCALALGFFFSDQIGALVLAFEHIGLGLGGAAIFLIGAYIGWSWFRRRQLLRRLRVARISADELAALMAKSPAPMIVDARSKLELNEDPFAIPGALVLQGKRLEQAVADVPMFSSVVVYCSCPNEISAAAIAKRMSSLGFTDVRPLLGGLDAWREGDHPVVPIAASEPPTVPVYEVALGRRSQ